MIPAARIGAVGPAPAIAAPVQPGAHFADASLEAPTAGEGFAWRMQVIVPPAVVEGGGPAPEVDPLAEMGEGLAMAVAAPAPQEAVVAMLPPAPQAQSQLQPQIPRLATGAAASPSLPLQLASLDQKDAVTQSLRAQLLDAGSIALAGTTLPGAPAPTVPATTHPLSIQPNPAIAAGAPGDPAAPVFLAAAVAPPPPVTVAALSTGPASMQATAAAAALQMAESAPAPPVRMAAVVDAAGAIASPAAPASAAPDAAVVSAAAPATAAREPSETLAGLLGQRIQAQLQQGVQQAVIRLEPYMAGTVQLELRHEAGVLRVHLSASHDEVVRQLQGIGESLRQDLAGRQFNEVSVQVGQQRHGDAQGQGRHAREETPQQQAAPGRALGESDEAYSHFAAALRRVNTSGA